MSARFFPKAHSAHNFSLWPSQAIKARLIRIDGTITDTAVKTITGVTNANPAVFTVASTSGWTTGDIVVTRDVLGNLAANQTGILQVLSGTTFSLKTLDGVRDVQGSAAYTSGGCVVNLSLVGLRSDYDACEVGGVSANLASATNTLGVLNASNPTGMTLNTTANAMVLYLDVGSAGTDIPLHFQDGKQVVEIAADAASAATTLWVSPLAGAMDIGEVMTFSNGITATLTAAPAAGARSLSVSAISGAIAAGHQADVRTSNSGFPLSSGGGPVSPTFDTGPNKIGRL